MINLDQLPEHLKGIKATDWNKLFRLIPEIESTEKFGEVKGGDRLPDGTMSMPYWSSAKIVDTFSQTVNDLTIVPVYNWSAWKEGKSLLDNASTDYAKLDIETLCKLLTIIIRANRFSDGYLVAMFENGIMLKIIKAIKFNTEKGILRRE